MEIRKLTQDEVEFKIECLEEEIEIHGNAQASGDHEYDVWVEDNIIRELENGNQWAWCCVHVIAQWHDFEGDDYLGACSYESEESFKQPGGYWDDMKAVALADLQTQIENALGAIEPLIKKVA
jgi:hypothetical protein